MENMKYCLVLRVCNLQKCKLFYRNTLGLGSPTLDTPFWVEFPLGNDGKLCLEAVNKRPGSTPANTPVWMLEAEDDIEEQLTAAGCKLKTQNTPEIEGYAVTAFQDPEGNVFYLKTNKE